MVDHPQTTDHEADRCDEDPCFGAGDRRLEVLGEAATASEQSEGALDHPTPGQQHEALGLVGSLDDFHVPATVAGERRLQLGAGVAAIGEDVAQPGQQATDRDQQRRGAVAVLDVGGVDLRRHQMALGVGQDVALAPLDLLAGVEAARAGDVGAARRLAVDHPGARAGLPALGLARRHHQVEVDRPPQPAVPPGVEVAADRRNRRVMRRQGAPLAAGPGHIENGVDHRPKVGGTRATHPLLRRHEWLDHSPLRIRQRICTKLPGAAILPPGVLRPTHLVVPGCDSTPRPNHKGRGALNPFHAPVGTFGSGSNRGCDHCLYTVGIDILL